MGGGGGGGERERKDKGSKKKREEKREVKSMVSEACFIFNYIIYLFVLEGRKEMFYLTTYSTHYIYGYMTSYI